MYKIFEEEREGIIEGKKKLEEVLNNFSQENVQILETSLSTTTHLNGIVVYTVLVRYEPKTPIK